MCGRYYIDDDTTREIEKLVQQIDDTIKISNSIGMLPSERDIHPGDWAPILMADNQEQLCCRRQRWGFPNIKSKQVIFNARSETVFEKKMFRQGMECRRVVIPATWFYEWDQSKNKYVFYRENYPIIYMAGIYGIYGDEERYVILTTAANESVKPVHDRMPLLLERDEIIEWTTDRESVLGILQKKPCLLHSRTDFKQMTLF